MHPGQKEAFGRCRGRGDEGSVLIPKEFFQVQERPPPPRNFNQAPHKVPHHMMEESVGSDVENNAQVFFGTDELQYVNGEPQIPDDYWFLEANATTDSWLIGFSGTFSLMYGP